MCRTNPIIRVKVTAQKKPKNNNWVFYTGCKKHVQQKGAAEAGERKVAGVKMKSTCTDNTEAPDACNQSLGSTDKQCFTLYSPIIWAMVFSYSATILLRRRNIISIYIRFNTDVFKTTLTYFSSHTIQVAFDFGRSPSRIQYLEVQLIKHTQIHL